MLACSVNHYKVYKTMCVYSVVIYVRILGMFFVDIIIIAHAEINVYTNETI